MCSMVQAVVQAAAGQSHCLKASIKIVVYCSINIIFNQHCEGTKRAWWNTERENANIFQLKGKYEDYIRFSFSYFSTVKVIRKKIIMCSLLWISSTHRTKVTKKISVCLERNVCMKARKNLRDGEENKNKIKRNIKVSATHGIQVVLKPTYKMVNRALVTSTLSPMIYSSSSSTKTSGPSQGHVRSPWPRLPPPSAG